MGVAVFVDSHAHLYDRKFDGELPAVIERAQQAGVMVCVVPGDRLETSRDAAGLAVTHPDLYAAVGFHPHESKDCSPDSLEEIRRMTGEPKVVAVGEIGLDYHYDHSPRGIQKKVFSDQLRLATETGLPVIMHCREAYTDFTGILRREARGGLRGVCHCFSGTLRDARALLEMGFHISFAGPVTYPKAEKLREVAAHVPLERMLLETDSPYLAPQPKRGRRNEPAYVIHNAEQIAALHEVAIEDVAGITTQNAVGLFGINDPERSPVLAYEMGSNLYINITHRCTNNCVFCRRQTRPLIVDNDLRLDRDPPAEQIIGRIHHPETYDEIVFCGFGEPLLRLDAVKQVALWLRKNGARRIRIDTNGQGNLIHGRNVVPELTGLVDAVSISLNACNAGQYQELCHSQFGIRAYDAVKQFIRDCRGIFDVTVSIVGIEGVAVDEARRIVEQDLGCRFRLRRHNP